jgi:hypothetical protein
MVVSDSGLAAEEPKWYNCSPLGVLLIGIQPRGGWQVMQRTVQWGEDHWAHAFGVHCARPVLYAYLACSIRNRLEVWDSNKFWSPMENVPTGGGWKTKEDFHVKRPTKLVDGSRGGQAFICDLLRPEAGHSYSIDRQSHVQLLSVLLVAASLIYPKYRKKTKEVMEQDFDLHPNLGLIFRKTMIFLAIGNVLSLAFALTILDSVFRRNIVGPSQPYLLQLASFACWSVGAVGLLALGGNPRVEIYHDEIPNYVKERLNGPEVEVKTGEKSTGASEIATVTDITIHFGSLHGSIFTVDKGSCSLPKSIVEEICKWQFRTKRTVWWMAGVLWFGAMLLLSMTLLIVTSQFRNIWSDVMGVGIILLTSVARGSGLSGSEEWMIPRWKRRANTTAGARLLGSFISRA